MKPEELKRQIRRAKKYIPGLLYVLNRTGDGIDDVSFQKVTGINGTGVSHLNAIDVTTDGENFSLTNLNRLYAFMRPIPLGTRGCCVMNKAGDRTGREVYLLEEYEKFVKEGREEVVKTDPDNRIITFYYMEEYLKPVLMGWKTKKTKKVFDFALASPGDASEYGEEYILNKNRMTVFVYDVD